MTVDLDLTRASTVRYQTLSAQKLEPNALGASVYNCAFAVDGAPNVMAETVKRGEDDGFGGDDLAERKKSKRHVIVRYVLSPSNNSVRLAN